MSASPDGFLTRWSRRKAGLGEAVEESAAEDEPAPLDVRPVTPDEASLAAPPAPVVEAPPLPTLADVAALTRESDYSRFVMPGVDRTVSNAAMKKLFSDPHFNVMDGLDTYIDDYGKPDPIPLAMLRRMNQSAVLGLFADEVEAAPNDALSRAADVACPDGAGAPAVAQSLAPAPLLCESELRADDDPDLRLQPDDAARRPGPESGSGD